MNEWMTSKGQSRQANSDVALPWLTVEIALWGLIFATALGLRLLRLDAPPLNTNEARDALAAWRFAQGEGLPSATGYSPFLFSSQWFAFLVLGATDLTARLIPALAGTALALTPILLRVQLGRIGALLASALLALSPTALFLSRTASGDIFVALGALLCASGLWRYLNGESPEIPGEASRITRSLVMVGLGCALMLAASPLAYSAIISVVLALVLLAAFDEKGRDGLRRGWSTLRTTSSSGYYALGAFLSGLVLFSTAFAWHFGGLAAAADLLSQWFDGFVLWPDSLSVNYPGLILIFYEPLILLTGAAGMVLAAARGNPFSRFMALWSVLALLQSLVRPGRGPGDVLLVLVPLACLGGLTLATLFEGLRQNGHWANEGLFVAVTLPLWAYLLINLAAYSSQAKQYTHIDLLIVNVSLPTFLSLVIATAFLLLILVVGIGFIQGFRPVLRGLALSATMAMLVYTIATTVGLSQNRASDPRELLVLEPTATEARLLEQSLSRISNEHRGDARVIDLTVLTDDPTVAWLLREFRQATVAEPTESPAFTSAVVAPRVLGAPSLAGSYVGQTLPLRRRWEPRDLGCQWQMVQLGLDQVPQLDCSALAQWLVFRRSKEQPVEEEIVLWLRQDLMVR